MVAGRPRLGTFLIEQQIITDAQLDVGMQYQNDVGCRLGQALIQLGFCTDAQVALALAAQLEIPFVDLDQTAPEPDCVALLPRDVALRHRLLPVGMRGGRLLVATLDPYDIRVDEVLRRATGMNSLLAMAPERQLMDQIELRRRVHPPRSACRTRSGPSSAASMPPVSARATAAQPATTPAIAVASASSSF
jgi:hypothetical protein